MSWLTLYTVLFLCIVLPLAAIMLRYGRTLIWDPDGIKQPYNVIGMLGCAVRDLLAGKGWRMMNFSLGQGMDALVTCAFYGYADPLNLLGALASGRGIEIIYAVVMFLRIYLAGICFGLYARKMGVRDPWALGCASGIYISSGFIVRMIGRHPHFLNGPLLLPLLLLGVERVLQDRRWRMFTLAAALSLVVNFYFAYMNTLFVIAYIIFRLAGRFREQGIAGTARDGFTLMGAYLLGAAMSAVVFLPVARVYLINSRLGVETGYNGSMLHYARAWYEDMLAYAFAPWLSPGETLFINLAPLALFALLALFGRRDEHARLTWACLALSLLAACVPMAGRVLNGMSYVSCRWSYAIAVFASLGCALGLPALLDKPWKGRIAAAALVYAAVLVYLCIRRREPKQLITPVLIAAYGILLLAERGGFRWLTPARMRGLTAVFLAASTVVYTAVGFLPRGYNCISEQMPADIYPRIASQGAAQLIEDDGVYRVGQGMYDDTNSSVLGYMGTSYYWSLVDGENSEYYRKLGLPTQSTAYHLYNLGGSAGMNAVAAVKYFVQQEGENYVVPADYAPSQTLSLPNGRTADVYENTLALPLGYAFDAAMTEAAYDALPLEDKLRALTQRAIVAEGGEGIVPAAGLGSGAQEIEWSIAAADDAEAADGMLRGGENGRIALAFDAPEDGETYLIISGLELTSLKRQADGVITIESAQGRSITNVPHPRSNFYFPKKDFVFCLGSGPIGGCDIVFNNSNEYRFAAIRVVSLPLSEYRAAAAARRAEGMTDVALGNDRITGRIAVAGARVLQIAVPYSSGWRCRVDGAEQPVFRCGGLYMGVALDAGEHTIEMRYVTPGICAGAAVSAGALAVFAVLSLLGRRRSKYRS